jgi:carbamoyl-phosphate synthase large subunit
MVIRNYFRDEKVPEPMIRKGIALRYPEEVFLEGVGVGDLREPLPKGEVRPWF